MWMRGQRRQGKAECKPPAVLSRLSRILSCFLTSGGVAEKSPTRGATSEYNLQFVGTSIASGDRGSSNPITEGDKSLVHPGEYHTREPQSCQHNNPTLRARIKAF